MPGRSSSSSGRSSSSPRSSYSSSCSSYSRSSYTPKTTPVPPPTPASSPALSSSQQSIPQIQVQQPGFFSNMWQGFGLGAGQSIAHNIFRSDPKVTHIHENAPSTTSSTESLSKEFIQCMKDNNNDTELCKHHLDPSKYMS